MRITSIDKNKKKSYQIRRTIDHQMTNNSV